MVMAVTASRVSVTTSATLIAQNTVTSAYAGTDEVLSLNFLVKNTTGTDTVYLGPSGVTTSSGFAWAATDAPVSITLEPGESLYGIVPTTTQSIHVLGGGR